jgi:hypothetical protein
VEEGGATDSGASHHYSAMGDQTLCVCVLILAGVNCDSCAHYIGVGDGTHYPLIEGIALDQGREVDLVLCGSSPLEINSSIPPFDLHGSILNIKLET